MAVVIRGREQKLHIAEGETVSYCCDGVPGQPFETHAPDCRYANKLDEATVDPSDPLALQEGSAA